VPPPDHPLLRRQRRAACTRAAPTRAPTTMTPSPRRLTSPSASTQAW
jgi:hypothetical protein